MKLIQFLIIVCYLLLLNSCGFDKTVWYKPTKKEFLDFGNDTLQSSLHLENLQDDKFKFWFFCRPLVDDSIVLKNISVSLTDINKQDSKQFDLLSIEIEKYQHQKPTYYKTFTDLSLVNDSFKIIAGKKSSTTLFFTYKDSRINKERNLVLNLDFTLLLKNCKKELTIKKTIILKRKNEYTFWFLRNC